MAEKETKLLAMLDNQQQRLIQHTNGMLNKYNNNQPNTNPPAGAVTPGKVCSKIILHKHFWMTSIF